VVRGRELYVLKAVLFCC